MKLVTMSAEGRLRSIPAGLAPTGDAFDYLIRQGTAIYLGSVGWDIPSRPVVKATEKWRIWVVTDDDQTLGCGRDIGYRQGRANITPQVRVFYRYFGVVIKSWASYFHRAIIHDHYELMLNH